MPQTTDMATDFNKAIDAARSIVRNSDDGKGHGAGVLSDAEYLVADAQVARAEEMQSRLQTERGQAVTVSSTGTISQRLQRCEAWGSSSQQPATRRPDLGTGGHNHNGPPGTGRSGGGGMAFRDASTGQTVRTLTASEPLAADVGGEFEIGEYLQAKLTGQTYAGAIGTTDVGGGGALIPELYSRRLVDLARANSVCIKAGATTLPMGGPEITIARVVSDPTSHWRPEGTAVTASGMTFDRVTLRAKTLAAIVPLTRELTEDVKNFPQLVESAVSAAMGVKLDYACLSGAGAASEPKGLYNYDTVNSVTAVGTPTNYAEVSGAVGEILQDDYQDDPSKLAWIQHPRDAETYDGLTDTLGQPLRPTPWAEKLRRLYTTSVDDTLGGSSNESWAAVGDFREMVIGMRTSGVVIRVVDAGSVTDSSSITHNATSELKFFIVAHMRADMAILRPTWFCKLTGITTA